MTRKYYHKYTICNRCGNDKSRLKFKNFDGKPVYAWYVEYNEEKNWTGNWLCESCYKKEKYKNGDTNANLINEMRDRRTGNLDPNSSQAKGDLFEELTCRWRGVKNLNKENDNYRLPVDHSPDSELGIIDTKGSFYSKKTTHEWAFNTEREYRKDVDNIICYCLSKDEKYIVIIYIFPRKEFKRNRIYIYENPVRGVWYNKYRVDENTVKIVDDIFQKIILTSKI